MRDNYDDMDNPSRGYRGRGNAKKQPLIILFLILLFLIIVVLFLILFPKTSKEAGSLLTVPKQAAIEPDTNEKEAVKKTDEVIVENPEPVDPIILVPVTAQTNTQHITPSTAALDIGEASRRNVSSNAVHYFDYIIQENDNINTIANEFNLSPETLISVNKIKNISGLLPGQSLKIPDRDGVLYTVQNGDMLSTIAKKFNPRMGWQTLLEVNDLRNEMIKVGQELFIPNFEQKDSGEISKNTVIFNSPLVKATQIASYGQRVDGEPLNGIYYTASAGSAVSASADGTVIDIGNDLSLGRFVSILHSDGYKTTYAFLETVEVKLGKAVKIGDVIGSIGNGNGRFTRPTLYFKLEQSDIALNPSVFF